MRRRLNFHPNSREEEVHTVTAYDFVVVHQPSNRKCSRPPDQNGAKGAQRLRVSTTEGHAF
jgi:hypothetical protein